MEGMVLLTNQFIDILAYVTIGIIALYFLLFLIPLIFALTKKKEVLKKQKNINLIFIQQSHVLSDVVKLIHEEDVTLDVSLMEKIAKINQSLVGRKDMIKKEEINEINTIQNSLILLLKSDNPKAEQYKESLAQLADIYRKDSASYNLVVNAYNYWISFLPYRPLFKIFKFKQFDLI